MKPGLRQKEKGKRGRFERDFRGCRRNRITWGLARLYMEVERGDIFQVTDSNAGVGTAEENRFEHIHCLKPTTL